MGWDGIRQDDEKEERDTHQDEITVANASPRPTSQSMHQHPEYPGFLLVGTFQARELCWLYLLGFAGGRLGPLQFGSKLSGVGVLFSSLVPSLLRDSLGNRGGEVRGDGEMGFESPTSVLVGRVG